MASASDKQFHSGDCGSNQQLNYWVVSWKIFVSETLQFKGFWIQILFDDLFVSVIGVNVCVIVFAQKFMYCPKVFVLCIVYAQKLKCDCLSIEKYKLLHRVEIKLVYES